MPLRSELDLRQYPGGRTFGLTSWSWFNGLAQPATRSLQKHDPYLDRRPPWGVQGVSGVTDEGAFPVHREGQWSVLEQDPEPQAPVDPPAAAQQPPPAQQQPYEQLPPHAHAPHMFGRPGQRWHNNAGAYFSHELEELKARLERLLPEE